MSANRYYVWVIEDRFAAGRPAWEKVGVEMVDSVAPYEEAKIRLLNATHSCIAWAGTLAGFQYIHEGTHDAEIRKFAYDYVTDDTIPCLHSAEKPSPGPSSHAMPSQRERRQKVTVVTPTPSAMTISGTAIAASERTR